MAAARGARARRRAWPSCTPSTTPTSSPGRARSASSCSRTSPTWPRSSCPVGGGGLASGVAIAVKSARPEVEVVGVQVDSVAAYPESLRRGEPVEVAAGADDRRRHRGQAPRRADPRRSSARWLDDVVVVAEDEVAEAMVAAHGEGQARRRGRGRRRRGGAAGRPDRARRAAARRSSCSAAATSTRACWPRSRAATRARPGRRLVSSRACPTARARWRACSSLVGEAGANLVDVEHLREGARPPRARDRGAARARDARARARRRRARAGARRGLRGPRRALAVERRSAHARRPTSGALAAEPYGSLLLALALVLGPGRPAGRWGPAGPGVWVLLPGHWGRCWPCCGSPAAAAPAAGLRLELAGLGLGDERLDGVRGDGEADADVAALGAVAACRSGSAS